MALSIEDIAMVRFVVDEASPTTGEANLSPELHADSLWGSSLTHEMKLSEALVSHVRTFAVAERHPFPEKRKWLAKEMQQFS